MTISLRNLPKEVEQAILETSRREGISLSKTTIRLLEAHLHKPAKNPDFEEFRRTWSGAEADAFDAALAEMRKVDPADCESRVVVCNRNGPNDSTVLPNAEEPATHA